MSYYVAFIHKNEDSEFGVSFPDVPGVIASGETLDEAIDDGREALAANLELMLERGEEVPPPSTVASVRELPEARDAHAIVVIEMRVEEPATRINTTLPASLVDRIDREADKRGMSRSAFLAAGARALLLGVRNEVRASGG